MSGIRGFTIGVVFALYASAATSSIELGPTHILLRTLVSKTAYESIEHNRLSDPLSSGDLSVIPIDNRVVTGTYGLSPKGGLTSAGGGTGDSGLLSKLQVNSAGFAGVSGGFDRFLHVAVRKPGYYGLLALGLAGVILVFGRRGSKNV